MGFNSGFKGLILFIVYELWRGATEVISPGKLTRIFGLGFLTLIMNHSGNFTRSL